MTGGISHFILASVAFTGGHMVLSTKPVRDPIVAKLGEGPFLGLYSLLMAAALAWMILAFNAAPYHEVWFAPTSVKHLSLSLMLPVCIFVVASLTPKNPTMATGGAPDLSGGPRGIFRITRHPMMWGIGIWALLHLAANGDAASIIFFGAMAILALLGPILIDKRRARLLGADWDAFTAQTSYIPFAAIIGKRTTANWREIGWLPVLGGIGLYLLILVVHESLFGVAPMSWVSGIFS